MTRNVWKEYIEKFSKDEAVSIYTLKDMLSDWNENIEIINKKLNQCMDEIFKLNKEINR